MVDSPSRVAVRCQRPAFPAASVSVCSRPIFETGELRKHGSKIRLQEQPFQVLALLLERPGETVTRDELRSRLWTADTFVDFDHGLNKAINKIRETLGDSATSPRFVETVARRGYRFIADVAVVDRRAPAGHLHAGDRSTAEHQRSLSPSPQPVTPPSSAWRLPPTSLGLGADAGVARSCWSGLLEFRGARRRRFDRWRCCRWKACPAMRPRNTSPTA